MKPTQKPRQRQRIRRRMVLLFLGSFVIVATLVTTVVFNTTNVETSHAQSDKYQNYCVVDDQSYTNSFSLEAPIMCTKPLPQEGTLLCRKVKSITPGNDSK
jgi:hypothetical protein